VADGSRTKADEDRVCFSFDFFDSISHYFKADTFLIKKFSLGFEKKRPNTCGLLLESS
jgi:hypothetical protein